MLTIVGRVGSDSRMEETSNLGSLIASMEGGEDHFHQARHVYPGALQDYEHILKSVDSKERYKLYPIDEFLDSIEREQRLSAKAAGARRAYDRYIVPFYKANPQNNPDTHRSTQNSRVGIYKESQSQNEKRLQDEYATKRLQNGSPSKQPIQESISRKNTQSKVIIQINRVFFSYVSVNEQASRSLRANNPNITDLSDPNRPTKVAERFSELYDNEWTGAFEEIRKWIKSERTVIEYLLRILKRAYKYSEDESKRLLDQLVSSSLSIVKTGTVDNVKVSTTVQQKRDTDLLVQYRKKVAAAAVVRIKKDFIRSIDPKAQLGPRTRKYGEKCVELTWWMCVQDPPMCIVAAHGAPGFKVNLYRAYTKSGPVVDYIVWPALLLDKDGVVITKGVAQYNSD